MESDFEVSRNKKRLRSVIFFILKIVFAVSVISWLINKNYQGFLNALDNFNCLWLIPAGLFYCVHFFVGAWRWHMLLKVQSIKINYFEAFSLTVKSYFFSLVIPGGAIGGDVAKVGFIASRAPKGRKFEGSFTVLIDRFTGMMGLFSIASVVLVFTFPVLLKLKGNIMGPAIMGLAGLCAAGLCAGLFMFFHRQLEKIRFIASMIALADKLTKGTYSRISNAFDIYRNSFKTLLLCIFISIIFIHINMVFIVYFIARGLEVTGLSMMTFFNAVTIGNTAGLIPISISGVGARDAVIETLLKAGGASTGDAIAIPIIYTAVILCFNLLGGLFFIFDRHRGELPEDITVERETGSDD